jgi:hypothetical protein
MAEVFQFGFGDPSQYSDFAQYAGLDRKTGMPTPYDLSPEKGVPPPENLSDVFQQKVVDPFNKKVDKVTEQGKNISNAFDEFGQGNLVRGINAAKGVYKATGVTGQQTQTNVQTTPWDLNTHFGLD